MTLLISIPIQTYFDNPLKAIRNYTQEADLFLDWVEAKNIQLVFNQEFNESTGKVLLTAKADLTGIKDSKATYWALKLIKA
jgi:hypothetical protein